MGAQEFMQMGTGNTAQEAFIAARESAAWENGHGGYTGSLAEKHSFTLINTKGSAVSKQDAIQMANKLLQEGDERVDDKWGPAGAIFVTGGKFLFFGWASS